MASRYALGSHAPSGNCDILIIGKTGMGKSTTGNRLLGIHSTDESSTPYFLTRSGREPVTKECQFCTNVDGVRVLDTPGFADNKDTNEHGVFTSNSQIFHSIVQEQEKHNLQFCRVLYFLPTRGPLESADGVLQQKIKAMHGFWGDDIFNVMVLIATSHPKHPHDFKEEDYDLTSKVFMKAFKNIIGKSLRKCPPIVYLPVEENEDNILRKIVNAEVIDDKRLLVPQEEAKHEPIHGQNVNKTTEYTAPREPEDVDSGTKLQFEGECTRCSCKIKFESTSHEATKIPVAIVTKNEVVPYEGSICHPFFTPKYSDITKLAGGMGHVATLGIFAAVARIRNKTTWPGFTNSNKVCPVCKNPPGSEGCSVVGDIVNVPIGKEREEIKVKVSHSAKLDSPPK